MSRLPQPGDAVRAARVLNGRMEAGAGATAADEMVTAGAVVLSPDGITGPGAPTLLAVYGDLFDITEALSEAGFARLVENHIGEIEGDAETLEAGLVALALQGIAFGVLMERNRWERGAADRSILLSAAKFALAVLRSDHAEVGAAHGEDVCWLCAAEDKLVSAVAAADAADEDVSS